MSKILPTVHDNGLQRKPDFYQLSLNLRCSKAARNDSYKIFEDEKGDF